MLRRNPPEWNMNQSISPDKGTATPQAIEPAGHKDWERIILGGNGVRGTFLMVGYVVVFAVVFGTIFYLVR
jgi:hypothetical protein